MKGVKAQYFASKLLFLYEQWCKGIDQVKYQNKRPFCSIIHDLMT